MAGLRSFVPVGDLPGSLFLLPEEVMAELYDVVIQHRLLSVLELGSGFGATSSFLAAAAQEVGGQVTTVDMFQHVPASPKLLDEHLHLGSSLNIVVDPLGYNWWLAARLRETPLPQFDLVFLDGAHRWEPDALAAALAIRLLKPGGWFVLDDLNFNLRGMPNWQATHAHMADRELDSFQLQMVWDIVVTTHPELEAFRVSHGDRVGWARKRHTQAPVPSFLQRMRGQMRGGA